MNLRRIMLGTKKLHKKRSTFFTYRGGEQGRVGAKITEGHEETWEVMFIFTIFVVLVLPVFKYVKNIKLYILKAYIYHTC